MKNKLQLSKNAFCVLEEYSERQKAWEINPSRFWPKIYNFINPFIYIF